MPKPILAFRSNASIPIPTGKSLPISKPHTPGRDLQVARVTPQLQALDNALRCQSANLQANIQGIEPEFVLVFEVVGKTIDFYKAAEKAGLEWLLDIDYIHNADNNFYELKNDGSRSDKDVSEKLYLTMTNQRAMQQMLSLWNRYSRSEALPYGYSVFNDVFTHLRSVRRWEASDRLDETSTSILNRLLEEGCETVRFEIELWYRQDNTKRVSQKNHVVSVLNSCGGHIIHESIHNEIAFHGIIAESPADEIRNMLSNGDYPLLGVDAIKFVRPTGQTAAYYTEIEETDASPISNDPQPTKDPVIALFDGLPLANHTLLANRLIINDPENFADDYLAEKRQHGTEMSSLIIHGDLHNKKAALDSYLYVRPIMKPNLSGDECVPNDRFFVDLLLQAVLEIVNEPTLSTIRIINLSIGDLSKPFTYALSPEAKMLDYLSEKYNLLFIVSAGNNNDNIDSQLTVQEFKIQPIAEKQRLVYEEVWNTQQYRKILAPAEAINAVTVGASYQDYAHPSYYGHQLPVAENYPAPYSCLGAGYQGAIKPDMINSGGRMGYSFCRFFDGEPAELRVIVTQSSGGVGQGVAFPLNRTSVINSCGTSNAAALTSRLCADYLNILHGNPLLSIPVGHEAVALKTMLIHSCSWGNIGKDLMAHYVPNVPRRKKAETLKWIGYGFPNQEYSSFCTDQRVTVMGYGTLNSGMQTHFVFPLPDCLISQAVKKRLTLTLAWMSPTAPNNKDYKLAKLSYLANGHKQIASAREDSDEHSAKRGTVQHDVFEDNHASTYISGSNIEIVVQYKKNSHSTTLPVKFVLMATLEVAPETQLPIYQQVETLIRTQVQA